MDAIEQALAEHQQQTQKPFRNQFLTRVDTARIGTVEYKVEKSVMAEERGRRERVTRGVKREMDNSLLQEGGKKKERLFSGQKRCSRRRE